MLRFGIFLILLSIILAGGVVWLDTQGIYILAGAWGSGFGTFCLYFIWGLFVLGLGLALVGNILRIMSKVRD
jgi:hypothetical protein